MDESCAHAAQSGTIVAPPRGDLLMTDTLSTLPDVTPSSRAARRLGRPRWTDPRLLLGVVLVIGSVLGVARVVAVADDTVDVWVMRGDVAAGTTLSRDDVELRSVKLATLTPYFTAATSPVGGVTTSDFVAGELVSRVGVASATDSPQLRWLTLPVERHHLPADLQRGEKVDVYLVERTGSGEPVGQPRLVLGSATVADVDDGDSRFGGSSLELGVSLAVASQDVASLVAAEARGTITMVRVPAGSS